MGKLPKRGLLERTGLYCIIRHYKYPDFITLEQTTIITGTEVATYYIWNTCFTPKALIEEVKNSGFKVNGLFENVAGKDYHKNSPTIAILLEK